jgi:hypothetical protein
MLSNLDRLMGRVDDCDCETPLHSDHDLIFVVLSLSVRSWHCHDRVVIFEITATGVPLCVVGINLYSMHCQKQN